MQREYNKTQSRDLKQKVKKAMLQKILVILSTCIHHFLLFLDSWTSRTESHFRETIKITKGIIKSRANAGWGRSVIHNMMAKLLKPSYYSYKKEPQSYSNINFENWLNFDFPTGKNGW